MQRFLSALLGALLVLSFPVAASELQEAVKEDYDDHLAGLWDHFHRNPELSTVEFKTAARMAEELRAAGFEVTEGVCVPTWTAFPSRSAPGCRTRRRRGR
jgi:hippurate hydrolase